MTIRDSDAWLADPRLRRLGGESGASGMELRPPSGGENICCKLGRLPAGRVDFKFGDSCVIEYGVELGGAGKMPGEPLRVVVVPGPQARSDGVVLSPETHNCDRAADRRLVIHDLRPLFDHAREHEPPRTS